MAQQCLECSDLTVDIADDIDRAVKQWFYQKHS